MSKFTFVMLAAQVAVVVGLAAPAPVLAAPAGPNSAQDTINKLAADGFKVIVNKVGHLPLDQCMVTAVRPGTDITAPGTSRISGRDPAQIVLYTTVYVDVLC